MQSTDKIEIFPGIYIGDMIVSLKTVGPYRKVDDILIVRPESTKNRLFYIDGTNTTSPETVRKATSEEEAWYKSTYKDNGIVLNIKDMPKVNDNYSIY